MNQKLKVGWWVALCLGGLVGWVAEDSQAQLSQSARPGKLAAKPLYRDPVFDGAADPVVVWNFPERQWYMFYTNRRANLPEDQIDGVNWVHGTKIGIARSRDGAKWEYVGTANLGDEEKDVTYWAPEVVFGNGQYHMYVTIVPGVYRDWNHPRSIAHYTSRDLKNWEFESTLSLASEKVIDACVLPRPGGGWRMWYNNEADKKSIYYADSEDLKKWADQGKAALPGQNRGEGPKVFRFQGLYWMVMDVWDGLAVYRSDDAETWARQSSNLLQQPGQGEDDRVKGQHADVVAIRNRAYIFYFTHPGRTAVAQAAAVRLPGDSGYNLRRSSIQVAELKVEGDALICDRDAPVRMNLRFRRRRQIHDPSTILEQDGRYWCFSTGMGVQSLYSEDLKQWHQGPPLFEHPPEWVYEVVPTQRGHFWAPDVLLHDGRYLAYYSVSAFGKRTSAIALATSPTLNPEAENYGWTDRGIVIQTDESDDYNAIDPGIVSTTDGKLWLTFGSFWSGIKLIELDPRTGLRVAADSTVHSLAHQNEIEAASIYHHDGYYYLFLNWGRCCRGIQSTYNIRVGRSQSITGPYLDREGVDMLANGGTLLLENDGVAIGPGHPAIFRSGGQLLLSYHFYSADDNGRAQLGIRHLNWDQQGWPQVAPTIAFVGSLVDTD